jgi:hypothetical protein
MHPCTPCLWPQKCQAFAIVGLSRKAARREAQLHHVKTLQCAAAAWAAPALRFWTRPGAMEILRTEKWDIEMLNKWDFQTYFISRNIPDGRRLRTREPQSYLCKKHQKPRD